jgi:hypothetical protein
MLGGHASFSGSHGATKRVSFHWRAGLIVVVGLALVVAASCVSAPQQPTASASTGKPASPSPSVRHRFIAHTDQICLQFRAGREALENSVFGSIPRGEPTPEQHATYYGALFPMAQAYMSALATLEAPPGADALLTHAVADSYAAVLLLLEGMAAYGQPELGLRAVVTERIDDHFQSDRPLDARLRAYGFHTCGAGQA